MALRNPPHRCAPRRRALTPARPRAAARNPAALTPRFDRIARCSSDSPSVSRCRRRTVGDGTGSKRTIALRLRRQAADPGGSRSRSGRTARCCRRDRRYGLACDRYGRCAVAAACAGSDRRSADDRERIAAVPDRGGRCCRPVSPLSRLDDALARPWRRQAPAVPARTSSRAGRDRLTASGAPSSRSRRRGRLEIAPRRSASAGSGAVAAGGGLNVCSSDADDGARTERARPARFVVEDVDSIAAHEVLGAEDDQACRSPDCRSCAPRLEVFEQLSRLGRRASASAAIDRSAGMPVSSSDASVRRSGILQRASSVVEKLTACSAAPSTSTWKRS